MQILTYFYINISIFQYYLIFILNQIYLYRNLYLSLRHYFVYLNLSYCCEFFSEFLYIYINYISHVKKTNYNNCLNYRVSRHLSDLFQLGVYIGDCQRRRLKHGSLIRSATFSHDSQIANLLDVSFNLCQCSTSTLRYRLHQIRISDSKLNS